MAGERVLWVQCLLSKHEDPNDRQHMHVKVGVMLHMCNPRTGVAETGAFSGLAGQSA